MNKFIQTCAALVSFALLAPFAHATQADENPLLVEDLQCRGNTSTSCDFILGYVYLGPGDRLDETEVRNAQLRLATLGMFDAVSIFLEKGSGRGKAIVVVEVAEGDPLVTEWLIGASHRLGAFRSVTAGRVTHQNLFGAGKLADFSVFMIRPLSGPSEKAYTAELRYADPHLFGSKRYFGIVSASQVDGELTTQYRNFNETTRLRFGATLGRRLGDFSYLTIGYGYRARLDSRSGRWRNDGTFELDNDRNRHAVDVLYGWNSEDDIYFPTQGSSFHTGFGYNFGNDDDREFHLQFRKTWAHANGFVSLRLGGDPSPEYRQTISETQFFTASYARPVAPGEQVRRGRWYIETGYSNAGYKRGGTAVYEIGLKLGVRLETQTLGLIDLYVLGTQDVY